MIELIKKELLDRRKSLIAYSLGGFLLLWLYILIFPSIQNSSAELKQALDSYPKEILQAFGIQDLNFNTLEKYLGAENFSLLWPILVIILALSRAGNFFAGEVEKGTMGLLLSLPITRTKLFFAKYFSGLISVLIFCIFSILGVIPLAILHGVEFNTPILFRIFFLGLVFGITIFSMSCALSTLFKEKGKVYFALSATLLIMYVLDIISKIKPDFDWLQYASVFHYFNAQDVLAFNSSSYVSYLVFFVLIILGTTVGLKAFIRSDINN